MGRKRVLQFQASGAEGKCFCGGASVVWGSYKRERTSVRWSLFADPDECPMTAKHGRPNLSSAVREG